MKGRSCGAALREGEEENEDEEAAQVMQLIADDIKSGALRSKSGEGYFVLKGEFYDAIESGRKTTEYRDLTPRNLSLSIGIKTVTKNDARTRNSVDGRPITWQYQG